MYFINSPCNDYKLGYSLSRSKRIPDFTIDDKGIQRILRDVDKRDLALALKVSDEKIRSKIFKNMSERAAAVVKEELEFMGPVKLKEVESAQMRIVDVIKKLEEQDEIAVGGRGKEDIFV